MVFLSFVLTDMQSICYRRVEPTCPTSKVLKKGDILLQFDGTVIGNDGTVAFRSGERINFSYLISEKQISDTVRANRCFGVFPPRVILSSAIGNDDTVAFRSEQHKIFLHNLREAEQRQ